MRRLGLVLSALLSGCGGDATPAKPAAPAASAAPALAEIPRTGGRRPAADSDMRLIEPFTGDLDTLIERGVIRILAAPGAPHFEATATAQHGRTVDAAMAFEQFVNRTIAPRSVTVSIIEASETALINDVIAGHGDIAANVLRTFERDDKVAFATPLRTGVRELIVTGPQTTPLVSLEDAGGRIVHVRRNSDHHASLLRLNDQLANIDRPQVKIVLAAMNVTDAQLLQQVNDGRIPATIADDYLYDAHAAQLGRTSVNRDVAVSQDGEIAWVTRKSSPQLLALINEFFSAYRLSF